MIAADGASDDRSLPSEASRQKIRLEYESEHEPHPIPALALTQISKTFGAVQALREVSFVVRPGTVHALLGENGAGKSTLMRVAFGMLTPDSGTVQRKGRPVTLRSPADALAHGIGMVHQHFTLVPSMTVAENVALGGHGVFDPARAADRVREVATRTGLSLDPEARIDALPVGAQQRCEIVKALARDVSLLILDEPTAVLAPSEARELLAWVRRFADAGNAVVLITHKLRDALAVADDVTVLRHGACVLSVRATSVNETQLAAAMIGQAQVSTDVLGAMDERRTEILAATAPVTDASSTGAAHRGDRDRDRNRDAVLVADGVTYVDARGVPRVKSAALAVRAGEIVGLAAVEGAGQHELLRLLAGRLAPTSGRITRPDAIGFIPEDRHRDALLLDAPLFENLALRGAGARTGRIDWSAFRRASAQVIAARDVRTSDIDTPARALSGGNQQKFVVGRELAEHPTALIVENPSRGLDFVATAAVQQALRDARDAGTAVVVYSSDLDEVLQLADRVVVMFDGTLREVTGGRDAVGQAMLGSLAEGGR